MRDDYEEFYKWTMNSATVFGINESSTSAMSVSQEERERVYEEAWNRGGGFGFMLATFGDIVTHREANDTATDLIRQKIRTVVKDPAIAEKLCPTDLYAKRPLCCDNYYKPFNRKNVALIDVKSDAIEAITEKGIRLSSGREIELDVIILATGFDAITGNYLKIDTTGRNGLKLKDKWAQGPHAMIGVTIAGPFCS